MIDTAIWLQGFESYVRSAYFISTAILAVIVSILGVWLSE